MKKENNYQVHDGFNFLENCEKILKASKNNLSKSEILRINEYSKLAIQLLVDYPFYLAKAYRILGEMLELAGDNKGAISNYSLALKYNPKVGVKKKLEQLDPGNPVSITQKKRPPIQILYSNPDILKFKDFKECVPAGQAPRGIYYTTVYLGNFCIYSKNHYQKSSFVHNIPPKGETTVSFTTNLGEFIDKKHFDHLIYKLAFGSNLSPIVTISFDQQLRIFQSRNDDPISLFIPTFTKQHYEISGLFVNDNGSRIYYSSGETLYILDQKLRLIKKLKFSPEVQSNQLSPNNFVNIRSPKYQHALSLLKLLNNPSNKEIQVAYRARLLEVHPDINQNNPNANNETITIIEAYEFLTSNEHLEENLSFHERIFSHFRFYMPAFEDSISSFFISKTKDVIYLSYRSGRLLMVNDDYENKVIFINNSTIHELFEIDNYLILISQHITILKNHELYKFMEGPFGKIRIFPEERVIVILIGGLVKVYTLNLELVGEVLFRDSIADIYLHNQKLLIYTVKAIYEFEIFIKSNIIFLEK